MEKAQGWFLMAFHLVMGCDDFSADLPDPTLPPVSAFSPALLRVHLEVSASCTGNDPAPRV